MLRPQLILLPFLAILVATVGSSISSSEKSQDDEQSLWRNRRKWGDNAISAWGKRSGMVSYDYGDSAYPEFEDEAYERKNHFYETPESEVKKRRLRLFQRSPFSKRILSGAPKNERLTEAR